MLVNQAIYNILITYYKMKNQLEEAINDIITLCSSEIIRYSMQNFMEWFTKQQRHTIALSIAKKSYYNAVVEIENYFNNLEKWNSKY